MPPTAPATESSVPLPITPFMNLPMPVSANGFLAKDATLSVSTPLINSAFLSSLSVSFIAKAASSALVLLFIGCNASSFSSVLNIEYACLSISAICSSVAAFPFTK